MIKRLLALAAAACLCAGLALPALAAPTGQDRMSADQGKAMSQTGQMGRKKKPELRSYGYDYHQGVYGRGYQGNYSRCAQLNRGAYHRLGPQQQKLYRQGSDKFLKETLDMRKELAAKKVELRTLWRLPDSDPDKIRELSKEITGLRGEIAQKRAEISMSYRKEFGPDKGFASPADYGSDDDDDWWPFW